MASSYPSTQDNFTNPTASDKMNSATVPHATQHANLNDAVEALERKVGFSSSTSGAGIASPSTNVGDVFFVSDTSGRTAWGTKALVALSTASATSTSVATLDFVGIPGHFSDLLIHYTARGESTAAVLNAYMQFGAGGSSFDGSTSYDYTQLSANAGSVTNSVVTNATVMLVGACPGSTHLAGLFARTVITVHDYANTAMHKGVISAAASPATSTAAVWFQQTGGRWGSTTAVTNVRLGISGSNMAIGTKAKLWGLP